MSELVRRGRQLAKESGPEDCDLVDSLCDRIEALEIREYELTSLIELAIPTLEKAAEFLSKGPIVGEADKLVYKAQALLREDK